MLGAEMPLGSGAFGHKVLSRGPHADRQSAVQQRADAPASADWAVDAMQGGGTSLVQQAFMIFLVLLFAAAAVLCVLLGSQRATRTSELVRAVERSAADVIATTLTPRQLFVAWNGMALRLHLPCDHGSSYSVAADWYAAQCTCRSQSCVAITSCATAQHSNSSEQNEWRELPIVCLVLIRVSGVLTLAFDGFPPGLLKIKQRLNQQQQLHLPRESFGSKWPKVRNCHWPLHRAGSNHCY